MEQSGGSVAQQEEWIPDAAKIKQALPSVVIHFLLLPLQQGQEQPLRTREQCKPRACQLIMKGLILKFVFCSSPGYLAHYQKVVFNRPVLLPYR